jgi:hypothetical protein
MGRGDRSHGDRRPTADTPPSGMTSAGVRLIDLHHLGRRVF